MRSIIVLIFLSLLASCSDKPAKQVDQLVAVKSEAINNSLYYSGSIQPLSTKVVTSPVDGVIIDKPFQYGDKVHAKQTLYVISSAKFLTDYKSALLQYVKAKNEFNTNQLQLKEAKFLHENLLISDDDFKMKQSSYYASQLALLQARDALDILLKQMHIDDVDLENLAISDIDKITKAMHLQKRTENIAILAPVKGVVLAATKSGDHKKFNKGDAIKHSDVLAVVGNMQGLTVHVQVNELIVNQLKRGQKVTVTGLAFPQYTLTGEISRVNHQGEVNSNGLPTFAVDVVVPKLSLDQQSQIHPGMSAKVTIVLNEKKKLLVPITAIYEKLGQSYVKKYNPKTHQSIETEIQTGKTTQQSVIVQSGLHAGDQVVLPHQT